MSVSSNLTDWISSVGKSFEKFCLTQIFPTKYPLSFCPNFFGGVPKLHWVFKHCIKTLGFLIGTWAIANQNLTGLHIGNQRQTDRQVEHHSQEV